jgi:preprotein translocase subunit SecA
MQEFKSPNGDKILEFYRGETAAEVRRKAEAAKQNYLAQGFTFVRRVEKIGRNDICPCGSGQKFKKCCIRKAA